MAYQYFELLQAVENYYGSGSDQWQYIVQSGITGQAAYNVLKQVPGVNLTTNSAGDILSYSVGESVTSMTAAESAAAAAANAINSNAVTAEAVTETIAIPANFTAGATPGTVQAASGAAKVASGTSAATALGHVATWVVGAGVGMKLGVWLDGAFYESGLADRWDPENAWAYNPENWENEKVTNWLYDYSGYDDFNALIDEDGQVYVDQNLFALSAQYLAGLGAFSYENEATIPEGFQLNFPGQYSFPVTCCESRVAYHSDGHDWVITTTPSGSDPVYITFTKNPNEEAINPYLWIISSKSNFSFTLLRDGVIEQQHNGVEFTDFSDTFYYLTGNIIREAVIPFYNQTNHFDLPTENYDLCRIMAYGINKKVDNVDGAHIYDTIPTGITPEMTVQQILDLLEDQFPDIFDQKLKQGVLNEDGTITDKYYLPIAIPDGGPDGQPTTSPDHTGAVDPQNETQTRIATSMLLPTPNPTQEPSNPDTGTGNTPAIVLPTGSADALYKIYNPTNAQIQSFGAWLWSSNFVDQLLKVFNDPMQAIISLHKIYVQPHNGTGTPNIKVGYLDSGVASKWVDEQYVSVSCGSVSLQEQRASILDYDPFVDVRIFLPFIGIVKLDTADVMRGTISVDYKVDVITGTCIATVSVARDGGAGGVIYQYTGSMCESYPLSSGSFMGIITGVLGIAAGIGATIASGGAAAPALIGGAAGLTAMHTRVEHSNGFSGNAGALAAKIPYLIISRQQSALANNLGHYSGWPANYFIKLSQCKGFTRIKDAHLEGIDGATDTELQEIEQLLKKGVII